MENCSLDSYNKRNKLDGGSCVKNMCDADEGESVSLAVWFFSYSIVRPRKLRLWRAFLGNLRFSREQLCDHVCTRRAQRRPEEREKRPTNFVSLFFSLFCQFSARSQLLLLMDSRESCMSAEEYS